MFSNSEVFNGRTKVNIFNNLWSYQRTFGDNAHDVDHGTNEFREEFFAG